MITQGEFEILKSFTRKIWGHNKRIYSVILGVKGFIKVNCEHKVQIHFLQVQKLTDLTINNGHLQSLLHQIEYGCKNTT